MHAAPGAGFQLGFMHAALGWAVVSLFFVMGCLLQVLTRDGLGFAGAF